MKLAEVLSSVAVATSLAVAPVAAQASVADLRASTEAEGENLRGGFIIPAIAIVAIILGVLLLTDGDDEPSSP